ncbi:MAG TPA: FHA domain-containing protein [Myxococcales bacterium LLY-WYZ-16_1]|nr:FHA domain-containing protein [Myxococcales bacterium LLY-WYZ-16_1]
MAQDGEPNVETERRAAARRAVRQLLVGGLKDASTHPLVDGMVLSIGRGEHCAVTIDDPAISREHLRLETGPPITIRDLGSANGTLVQGQSLEPGQPMELKPGVVVEIGDSWLVIKGPLEPGGLGATLPPGQSLPGFLDELEKKQILEALERFGGNQSEVSRRLGIPRRTLLKKLDAYGVARPRKNRFSNEDTGSGE